MDARLPSSIELRAPAKINLALHVTGRRDDGYHEIETLVVFTAFGDRVTATKAGRDSFKVTGPCAPNVPADATNLVIKARDRLRDRFGDRAFPVAITLEKNLPAASGIGGGSSDAAATLKALARLWGIGEAAELEQFQEKWEPVFRPELRENKEIEHFRDSGKSGSALAQAALSLGADVPMCLCARPLVAGGIGEKIEPVRAMPVLNLVLVNPMRAVSTPAVFAALKLRENPPLPDIQGADLADCRGLVDYLRATRNDLEAAAARIAPEIGTALASLREAGAPLARMSGSGATCYGIFETPEAAAAAEAAIRGKHPAWFVIATETGAA